MPFRYCGWVKYAWSPHQAVVHGEPWTPNPGEVHTVLESKFRPRRHMLVLLHSMRNGGLSLLWQVELVGYYLPILPGLGREFVLFPAA